MPFQGLEVDAVCLGKNNVKSQKMGPPLYTSGEKSNTKKQYSTGTYIMIIYSSKNHITVVDTVHPNWMDIIIIFNFFITVYSISIL